MRGIFPKLARVVVVLWLVSLLTFLLVVLLPGDAITSILEGAGTPEQEARIRAELSLDRPLLDRYYDWFGHAVRGDLGESLIPPSQSVVQMIRLALPVSFQLAVGGLILALVVAVPLAVWSASRPNGRVDTVVSSSTFALLSTPSFVLGLLLVLVFVRELGWFPRAQWSRLSDGIAPNLEHAFLPWVVIGMSQLPEFVRVLRADLIATLQEPYVLAARAKGMPRWRVLVFDALRPSSFSLLTIVGVSFGSLIGSTVIVETVFLLPGVGTMIVQAAQQRDIPVIQGSVLVIATFVVVLNAVLDFLYSVLDPRLRLRRS